MKRLPKIPSFIIIILIVVLCSVAAFDLILLPLLVRTKGAAFLEQKSKGYVQAKSIRYIPFRGARLKELTILSKSKRPVFSIDKIYVKAGLFSLLMRGQIDFRAVAYPAGFKRPLIFDGVYRIKQKRLDMNFKMRTNLFARQQVISAKTEVLINRQDKSTMQLSLTSPDVRINLRCFLKEEYLFIEEFSGELLDSQFELIGDVQNISQAALNIYGNFELELSGLKKINPRYIGPLAKLKMQGRLPGDIFIGYQPKGIEVGIKTRAGQIRINQIDIEDVVVAAKLQNNRTTLTKFYGRLYGGELNLQGSCNLDSPALPASLNLNIFNLQMNEAIKEITGKTTPIHGRFFTLARLSGSLKNPQGFEGKAWVSAAGSNILRFPVFEGMVDGLRLPQIAKIEFKEAGGNFIIARRQIRTDDFKISGRNLSIYFKGYLDFAGNLAFDIQPHFSQGFLSDSSDIGKILGIFMDSGGNYMGEIKLKGTIQEPRYTFKPLSMEKIIPRGIEEGLKQLFKFKKKGN